MASELTPVLPSGAQRLRPLFAELDYHLAITAVLDGRSPGYIFTDDPAAPQVGLLWTQQRAYLAGNAADETTRKAVASCLAQQLRADLEQRGAPAFMLAYTAAWAAHGDGLLEGYFPMRGTRHVYERVPDLLEPPEMDGYTVQAVDGSILTRSDLSGREELLAEMQSERPSVADFLMKSFGYMAVRAEEIIGWCLSEYNTADRCELGIATAAPFRRRGVARATAVAAINRADAAGVRRIGWHCWEDNAPSIATARSLGFDLRTGYPVAFAYVDQQQALAVHGFLALEEGDVRQALDWLARAEALGTLPAWALVHKARAQAALGKTAVALALLEQAAEAGFTEFEPLDHDPYLAAVRATSTWTILRNAAG